MKLKYSTSVTEICNDYSCKVLITRRNYWLPYQVLLDQLEKKITKQNNSAKFLISTYLGMRENKRKKEKYTIFKCAKKLLKFNFFSSLIGSTIKFLTLVGNLEDSRGLKVLTVQDSIIVGDIIAAEYLRSPKYGDGFLKLDLRFYLKYLKYLILGELLQKDIELLLDTYDKGNIRFCIPETSFVDEMARRILIANGITHEYVFNKYKGKMHVFEYASEFEGRALGYTPKLVDITANEFDSADEKMRARLKTGKQSWTGNITDIDTSIHINKELKRFFPTDALSAVLCLHAVADDQFRCGLDCFRSIDDFHKFTIEQLLELEYQVILKAHPGIISAIHPDKSEIDRRYLEKLFDSFGLNYNKVLISESQNLHVSSLHNRIYAVKPTVSIGSIYPNIKPLVITHHGSVTFETMALGINILKYKFCKNREFNFCHGWSTREEYVRYLKYFRDHMELPDENFSDSYLDVVATLLRRNARTDYNDVFFAVSAKFLPDFPLRKDISDITELNSLINAAGKLLNNNSNFREIMELEMDSLLG